MCLNEEWNPWPFLLRWYWWMIFKESSWDLGRRKLMKAINPFNFPHDGVFEGKLFNKSYLSLFQINQLLSEISHTDFCFCNLALDFRTTLKYVSMIYIVFFSVSLVWCDVSHFSSNMIHYLSYKYFVCWYVIWVLKLKCKIIMLSS